MSGWGLAICMQSAQADADGTSLAEARHVRLLQRNGRYRLAPGRHVVRRAQILPCDPRQLLQQDRKPVQRRERIDRGD